MRLLLALLPFAAFAAIPVDLTGYRPGVIRVEQQGDALAVDWHDENDQAWRAVFSLDPAAPLIREISAGGARVLGDAAPVYAVTTGKRRGNWDAFFDHPGRRPEEIEGAAGRLRATRARVRTTGSRVEIFLDGLGMGLFSGGLAYTFFPGSRLIRQEAVVTTASADVAYFYHAGIRIAAPDGRITPIGNRGLAATALPGSLAVFPPPHQYFFARDVTNNLGYVWQRTERGFLELGIRQHADDGTRYYPWMNAPPGTEQRLGLFVLLGGSEEEVLRYTNNDRFPALPGYKTMATHWHFAYTVEAMRHGFDRVPSFKPVLKQMGVDIAMIMDFHGDGHPQDAGEVRLEELDAFFRACREQSDAEFLILPAEEANVHLGGHWALAFPRPVYWHMRRPEGRDFVTADPKRGNVYATGNPADLLELVRREQGLMWQTHPRTKGSTHYPDLIRTRDYFLDPRYLGAGWKQMPSDLASPRLGERALRLLDDMNNWGRPKKLLGEVDVFKIDETHELYAHMNANYVRLPALPSFDDWMPVFDALRRGDYFVTTGEVLIPEHSIEAQGPKTRVRATLRWTFPLEFAEVVWGDGVYTNRHTIRLDETAAFGAASFDWEVPAGDWKWMRLAVWDVAANGALTMPIRRDQ